MGNLPDEMQKVNNRADCHVGLRYKTREALNVFRAEMRKRLGRFVGYDELINILLREWMVRAGDRPNITKGDDE